MRKEEIEKETAKFSQTAGDVPVGRECGAGSAWKGNRENMIANYHSHTFRCNHATGTQREYVEEAIRGGYKIWGFADHTPYPFNNGFYSGMRMRPEELENYVDETLALKREYADDIEIHLGLEVEYYPRHFEDLVRLCEPYPIEYFLLAQHAVGNEYDGTFVGGPFEDEALLKAYCDQITAGLETGRFLYVAHPDLVHYVGSDEVYDRHIRPMCKKMAELGVPAEINFLGLLENRHYPNDRFWKIASEEGLSTVFGVDAHMAERVYLPQCEEKANRMVERYGLRLIPQIL